MSAGIYIHIPFCVSKCNYCDFCSVTGDEAEISRFHKALLAHIKLAAGSKWRNRVYNTIYFGGGTPPLIGVERIGEIIKSIHKRFSLTPTSEISIEMNPETASISFLQGIRKHGVNRVSIGVQSFDDDQLELLGRVHNAETAEKAIDNVQQAGFENFGLDLIFGIPGQTVESWRATLDKAAAKNPVHISVYCLTIEKGTKFDSWVKNDELTPVDNDTQAEMYNVLHQTLAANGYKRYEVSNYAKPGYECRHNLKYWTDRKYLGLGPSAHSYYTSYRKANFESLDKYITALQKGKQPTAFKEELSPEQKSEDRLMMGLRLAAGIDLHLIKDVINKNTLKELIQQKHLKKDLNRIALTDKGFLNADEIIVKLLKI